MTFRGLMHERNIYKIPPDFKQMAEAFPDFGKHVFIDDRGKSRIDFKNISALRCLTETLLQKDFNLKVEIPEGFLVPTVPQRLNYVLWIEDLLSELSAANKVIQGVDIGTGPCCIFALMGSVKNGWSFLATESSDESVNWAMKNVSKNNLNDKIEVLKVDKDSSLKDVLASRDTVYDFCCCNPPFYENIEEIQQGHKHKESIEKHAKNYEIIADGGEVCFVKKIIEDSLILKDKISLYTSMFGRKKHMKEIKNELNNIKDVAFTTTQFFQGNTCRWGIAWTFQKINFRKKPKKKSSKKPQPPVSLAVAKQSGNLDIAVSETLEKLQDIFTEFEINFEVNSQTKDRAELLIQSDKNTWSHQRRKTRMLKNMTEGTRIENSPEIDATTPSLKHSCEDELNAQPCKKTKTDFFSDSDETDEEKEASSSSFKNKLLYCSIKLVKARDCVLIEMNCPVGANRNSMHQIRQFLKNKL